MATSARLWLIEKDNLPRVIVSFVDAETGDTFDATGCTALLVFRLSNGLYQQRSMVEYEVSTGKFFYQFVATDLTAPGLLKMQAQFVDATGKKSTSKVFYREVMMSCFDEVVV
jgi:hypothetical protein